MSHPVTDITAQDWFQAGSTRQVMDALEKARPDGARFVGGCVRNALLGEPVSDIDIATQLPPEETMAALKAAGIRAIPTGIEHGTITAVIEHEPFEITTLRRDIETDGRHAVVAFTDDWNQDAARRDFRMNALYADRRGKIHDPTGGGLADIAARKIAFIGDARERLREDHLRNLRFFRFSAWYGHEIDATGLAACAAEKDGLEQIAAERIWKEIYRLLDAPSPLASVTAMHEAGVLQTILPECEDLSRLSGLLRIEDGHGYRFTGFDRFLSLLPRDEVALRVVAERLRMSGQERTRLVKFARAEQVFAPDMSDETAKVGLYNEDDQAAEDLILWQWSEDPDKSWGPLFSLARNWERPVFPVTGADLLAKGIPAGPAIGQSLREMEQVWIRNGFKMKPKLAE